MVPNEAEKRTNDAKAGMLWMKECFQEDITLLYVPCFTESLPQSFWRARQAEGAELNELIAPVTGKVKDLQVHVKDPVFVEDGRL